VQGRCVNEYRLNQDDKQTERVSNKREYAYQSSINPRLKQLHFKPYDWSGPQFRSEEEDGAADDGELDDVNLSVLREDVNTETEWVIGYKEFNGKWPRLPFCYVVLFAVGDVVKPGWDAEAVHQEDYWPDVDRVGNEFRRGCQDVEEVASMQLLVQLVVDPDQLFNDPNEVFLFVALRLMAVSLHGYRVSAAFHKVLVWALRPSDQTVPYWIQHRDQRTFLMHWDL
jgi:hypothetical protein